MPTTRLAPSPTGALHLGNARTFLVNWAIARQRGWRVLLRIEDLDGPRIKAGATEAAIDILQWLGMDWDEGPIYQSSDLTPYGTALTKLIEAGEAYPCRCTRTQILAASLSAPNAGDHELRYPGTCRPTKSDAKGALWEGSPDPDDAAHPATARSAKPGSRDPSQKSLHDPSVAWRLIAPDEERAFNDAFLGPQRFNPQLEVGDYLVATKGGQPSYQLAVVVDDARQGVTHVVRGADLAPSTARQLLLYERLKLGAPPQYLHLPIVIGEDGRRLAKRHGDTRLSHYRDLGTTPERVVGLLAEWSGIGPRSEMTAKEFAQRFDLSRLSHEQVVFTTADDAWLTEKS
ncbi:glutamate--tRNA ligase family protein [Botrimarina mediterranea]|uniref:glutamate--tRNA ligase family protein n=1 Tax=Botrimarina mediterranea TaxID=2528022 RepID=UPI00118A257B|nr:Glutamate--tRNA ligase [Planctomycetes bacterium K2D]